MKKFFKFLIMLVCFVPTMFLLTGCLEEEQTVKIKDISRTNFTDTTVTYTITYTDNTKFSYTVPIENTVSISNIEKTGSDKNVDIYTITLSNGQTSTFSVTNGVSISTINFVSSNKNEDCYEVKYSNGTTDYFYIPKEEDISPITLEQLYASANTNNQYDDILEFIQDYLTINVNSTDKTVGVSKAVLSAVKVNACYPTSKSTSYSFDMSSGAGVIYQFDEASDNAYIITNCHVVYNEGSANYGYAERVFVYVYGREDSPRQVYDKDGKLVRKEEDGTLAVDGGEYGIECEIIGASIANDIAVLKAKKSDILKNSPNARVVEICDSENVALCDDAIAIGNPQGNGISVTYGTISVISEEITVDIDSSIDTQLREFRIDTAVNSGNSGGGLFNSKGQLIGIVNAKETTNNESMNEGLITEGMGYALPSNPVVAMTDNMINNYNEKDGFGLNKISLGMTVYVDSSIAVYDSENLVTKIVEDVKVFSVTADKIASNIGIKVDDQILSLTINEIDYKIDRMYQLVELLYKVRIGDTLKFKCLSNNETVEYSYQATEQDFVAID